MKFRPAAKETLYRCLLVGASVLVAVAVVEVGLRAYGVGANQDRLTVYQFDEVLGWKTRPSTRHFRSTGHYAHFVYYDDMGLPTGAATWPDPPSTDRAAVALVGDSFVESYYVPYEESFPHHLDGRLRDHEVVNLGVSGYSPEQYLLRSRQLLPEFTVSVVVVAFATFNDEIYTDQEVYLGRYAKPVLSPDLARVTNAPLERLQAEPGPDQGRSWSRQVRRTAIGALLKPLYVRLLVDESPRAAPPGALSTTPDEVRRAVTVMAAIREVIPDADFLIAYMPSYPELASTRVFHRNRAMVHGACRELGIRCETPRIDGDVRAEDLYRVEEGHLSPEGSRWYAEFLLGVLQECTAGGVC